MQSLYTKKFPIRTYLKSIDINNITKGKNVMKGYINITCPLCGDDPSYHLTINLKTKKWWCWRNGSHEGDLLKLIMLLKNVTFYKAEDIVKSFYRQRILQISEEETSEEPEEKVQQEFLLPKYIVPAIVSADENNASKCLWGVVKPYYRYLKKRNVTDKTIKRLDIRACYFGDYICCLVFPVYFNKEIVNFVARDVTGIADLPYRNCPKEEALRPIEECLYGFDDVPLGSDLVVVEGVFDYISVIQSGFNCVGLFKNFTTDHQFGMILDLKPKHLVIFLDRDSVRESKALCSKFLGLVQVSYINKFVAKDPGSMSVEDIKRVMQGVLK